MARVDTESTWAYSMPASLAFLNTALATIRDTPEYAAFQTALLAYSAAGEEQKQAKWNAAYSDNQAGLSPAYRLRRAIRAVVVNTQASEEVTLSRADAEAAYVYLVEQVAPASAPPVSLVTPPSASFNSEDIDIIRLAAARLAAD